MPAPQSRAAGAIEQLKLRAADFDLPGIRQVQAGEQVEQRRLAGARAAGDDGQPASRERGVEPVEDMRGGSSCAVRLGDAANGGDHASVRSARDPGRFLRSRLRRPGSDDDDAIALERRRRSRPDPRAVEELLR